MGENSGAFKGRAVGTLSVDSAAHCQTFGQLRDTCMATADKLDHGSTLSVYAQSVRWIFPERSQGQVYM